MLSSTCGHPTNAKKRHHLDFQVSIETHQGWSAGLPEQEPLIQQGSAQSHTAGKEHLLTRACNSTGPCQSHAAQLSFPSVMANDDAFAAFPFHDKTPDLLGCINMLRGKPSKKIRTVDLRIRGARYPEKRRSRARRAQGARRLTGRTGPKASET